MLLFIASLGWILPKALCSTPTSLLPVYWRWPATYVILYELSNSASFRLPADLLMFTERKKKKKAVIVTRAWVNIVELLLLQDGILMFSAQFAYWLVGWPWRKCTRTGIDFIQLVTNSSQPCTGKKRASVSKRYTPHTTSPVLFSYFYCSLGFALSFLWRKQCHLLWMRGAEFVRTEWYKREVSICQRFNPTLMGKSKTSSSKCYWFML